MLRTEPAARSTVATAEPAAALFASPLQAGALSASGEGRRPGFPGRPWPF